MKEPPKNKALPTKKDRLRKLVSDELLTRDEARKLVSKAAIEKSERK